VGTTASREIVVQIIWQRPAQACPPGPAQIAVHRAGAQPKAVPDGTLRQPLPEPQAQYLAYLPHRQSLARHSDPLLLGKRSNLPVVEDCQRNRPATPLPNAFMITGAVFTIGRNPCSRSAGADVHDRLE
jgi:hypothetical protein